jgi:hypothetical protein
MSIESTPKRRFQFSLRTLLIVVALLAMPLAYIGNKNRLVSHRKAIRARYDSRVMCINRGNKTIIHPDSSRQDIVHYKGDTLQKPDLLRLWLGDFDINPVTTDFDLNGIAVRELRAAFPASDILVYSGSPYGLYTYPTK